MCWYEIVCTVILMFERCEYWSGDIIIKSKPAYLCKYENPSKSAYILHANLYFVVDIGNCISGKTYF